jgi:tetratricopeptide (TPR) repeat protein
MRNLAATVIVAAIICVPLRADEKAGGEPNSAARAELYKLINQVRTMKFSEQPGASVTEKSKAAAKHETAAEPNTAPAAPAKAAEKVEAKAVKEAAPLVQDPNTVTNPFELGESLYKLGRFKEAAACYRVALARAADKKQKVSESDQAWMLFQAGNCYMRTNPAEAVKAYRQLITDFPSSEWTPIAVGREQVLQWYTANHMTPKAEKQPVEKQQ